MRAILILFFCLMARTSLAQIVVDTSVIKTYNAELKKLSSQYKPALKRMEKETSYFSGIAIFIANNIDTLNIADAIYNGKSKVKITAIGLPSGKILKYKKPADRNENIHIPIPITALLNGDTLIIAVPPVFYPYVIHKVINSKLISTYKEYQKRDTIFRLSLSQPKTESLSIPVTTPVFKLSTKNFKAGHVIYGEVEDITDPYYVDDRLFTTGYIHKRLHVKYIFKASIADINKPNN